MNVSKYVVVINTDGTVTTYDDLGMTMPEFSGTLPILHKIVSYVAIKGKKDIPDELKLYDPIFKFALSGDKTKELIIPKYHILRFIKYVQSMPDDEIGNFDKLLEFTNIKVK